MWIYVFLRDVYKVPRRKRVSILLFDSVSFSGDFISFTDNSSKFCLLLITINNDRARKKRRIEENETESVSNRITTVLDEIVLIISSI